jgi:hypothetical protein
MDSTINIKSSTASFGVAYYDQNIPDGISDEDCELIFYGSLNMSANDSGSRHTISAILPQADRPYEYFEKKYTAFDTTLNFTNSALRVNAANGLYAVYQPDEAVSFYGNQSDYLISMVLNEGYYPTDWYKIQVQGVNADSAELRVHKDGYVLSGGNLSAGVQIQTSNRSAGASILFRTEYDSALIYEINETEIGIKLDKDHDGIYETIWEPDSPGDLNEDGRITAADAVILKKYLLCQQILTIRQMIFADINQDGSVNASDLSVLKQMIFRKK